MKPYIVYLLALLCIGLITFCLYAADKAKAKRGAWRIPERTLLLFSFFGGAIGGTLAMILCRHKTKHWYFKGVNLLGLAWQLALLGFLFIKLG